MKFQVSTLIPRRIAFCLILTLAALILASCDSDNPNGPDEPYEEINHYYSRIQWNYASSPLAEGIQKGSINYFNPSDFYVKEVFEDSLYNESELEEKIRILRCHLTEDLDSDSTGSGNYWSGVTRYLTEPIDLGNMNYIEIQILENSDAFPNVPITMHLNLGKISEDFYEEDLGLLNSEDQNGDALLDDGEDTGLDGIGRNDLGDSDLDDFDNNKTNVMGYEEYPYINRFEGNCILDSEDLNANNILDTTNSYLQFSLDLAGDEYLHELNSKGLRTYRIPVSVYQIITDSVEQPDLQNLEFVRFWFEYAEPTYVNLINAKFESNEGRSESVDLLK